MKMIPIKECGKRKTAVLVGAILAQPDDVKMLVSILMGRHESATEVLRDVIPGTVPDTMGAEQLIYLVFERVPSSDGTPFSGGVYAVQDWVSTVLDPAMPAGWGAAMTQPVMFPLVDYDGEGFEIVDHFAWLGAQNAGRRVANGIIISPMERAATGPATGNLIRDFNASEGTPTLLPV